jgi:hypothetical protein
MDYEHVTYLPSCTPRTLAPRMDVLWYHQHKPRSLSQMEKLTSSALPQPWRLCRVPCTWSRLCIRLLPVVRQRCQSNGRCQPWLFITLCRTWARETYVRISSVPRSELSCSSACEADFGVASWTWKTSCTRTQDSGLAGAKSRGRDKEHELELLHNRCHDLVGSDRCNNSIE